MDYEQKYKDGLECIQEILNGGSDSIKMSRLKLRLQPFFPELEESEDELTWLTKYIEEEAYSLSMDIRDEEDRIKLKKLQRSLAWLEKQKEPMVEKCGDWSDVRYMSILQELHFLKSLVEYEQYINKEDISKNIEWLKSLKHRTKK